MTFSLITATYGRVEEVAVLCESLANQDFKDFELYIVDQNEHDELQKIVDCYSSRFKIIYIKNKTKGLSRNRNIALKLAKGEYIGFPDDDCFYDSSTLKNVYDAFKRDKKAKFVATSTYDSETKNQNHMFLKDKIYKNDILKTCISYNIFVVGNEVLFDERLGVGTYFSSGEETDYLYSLCKDKTDYGVFCKSAAVFHPSGVGSSEKVYKYSLGFAALQKKDFIKRNNYKALFIFVYYLIRAIVGMILIKDFSFHYASFKGKVNGFYKFKV